MLTNAEALILKADILAKTNVVTAGSTFGTHLANTKMQYLANYYNSPASPVVNIWNPNLSKTDIVNALVGTDINANTTAIAARRDAMILMLQADSLDMTKATVRAAILAIMGATTSNTNVLAVGQRPATIFEVLFTVSNVCSRYNYIVTLDDIDNSLRTV